MAAGARDEVPLRVDWLDAASGGDGPPGRLGLTFLPGKRGASIRYPGRVYDRDLVADIDSLLAGGVTRLVLLVEDQELDRWGDARIVELAAARGLAIERHPFADGTAPPSMAAMRAILATIAHARAAGDVVVACMGGVGRTGTVAACALVDAGWEAPDAIAEVRRVRHPTAVETEEQVDFVHRFAQDAALRRG